MASLSSSQLLLFSCLLMASLLFTFSDNLVEATNSDDEPNKVNLNLYYESLCPYCQSFIKDDLVKVFNTDLYTIVNLKLVPFGNAEISGPNITCQHGEDECYLNAIEACAINLWTDPKEHFGFILCVESSANPKAALESCADAFGGLEPLKSCYDSGLATQLILGYGNETNSLRPPLTYVPWVTVNDAPLYDDFENFVSDVCKAYNGTEVPLPKVCESPEISTKLSSGRQACSLGKAV